MRLFQRKNQKNTLRLQGKIATATRALYDMETRSKMPVIMFYVEAKTPREDGVTGEIVDAIEVEMDPWEACKFASQLLATLDASLPKVPRGAQRIPWGES